jgi:hypothetical protein
MTHQAGRVDSAYLSLGDVRASAADGDIRAALSELEDGASWQHALDAEFDRLAATRLSRLTRDTVRENFERSVLGPNRTAAAELKDVLSASCEMMEEFADRAADPDAIPALDLASEFETQDQALREQAAQRFEFLTAKYRATLDMRAFSHTLEEAVERLPEELVLPKADSLPSAARSSTDIGYRRFEFRRVANRLLARKAMTDIETQAELAEQVTRDVSRRLY